MNVREEMAQLARLRATAGPETLAAWADALDAEARAAEGQWLSEERALRRSGHTLAWLRRRYRAWLAEGYARKVGAQREYLAAVVPRRGLVVEPADDPRVQAQRDAAA